jgi:hypothetical protein
LARQGNIAKDEDFSRSEMKTRDLEQKLIIISVVLAAAAAFGVLVGNFKSWHDLELQSSDIIVAKCTSPIEDNHSGKPMVTFGGITHSDIQVLFVLKGNTKPGLSRLDSLYQPYPGERLMVLGNYRRDENHAGYSAAEKYRIVPINRSFRIEALTGLGLDAQLQLVLSNRLEDLNEIIKRGQEEKARIEKGIKQSR